MGRTCQNNPCKASHPAVWDLSRRRPSGQGWRRDRSGCGGTRRQVEPHAGTSRALDARTRHHRSWYLPTTAHPTTTPRPCNSMMCDTLHDVCATRGQESAHSFVVECDVEMSRAGTTFLERACLQPSVRAGVVKCTPGPSWQRIRRLHSTAQAGPAEGDQH